MTNVSHSLAGGLEKGTAGLLIIACGLDSAIRKLLPQPIYAFLHPIDSKLLPTSVWADRRRMRGSPGLIRMDSGEPGAGGIWGMFL